MLACVLGVRQRPDRLSPGFPPEVGVQNILRRKVRLDGLVAFILCEFYNLDFPGASANSQSFSPFDGQSSNIPKTTGQTSFRREISRVWYHPGTLSMNVETLLKIAAVVATIGVLWFELYRRRKLLQEELEFKRKEFAEAQKDRQEVLEIKRKEFEEVKKERQEALEFKRSEFEEAKKGARGAA
jgi:hypothetical protein